MTDHTKYQIAAQKGAHLLDERRPGWFNQVSIRELEMDDPCLCVLGQVYGSFISGRYELDLTVCSTMDLINIGGTAAEHGFTLDEEDTALIRRLVPGVPGRMRPWLDLQDAWAEAIVVRRSDNTKGVEHADTE